MINIFKTIFFLFILNIFQPLIAGDESSVEVRAAAFFHTSNLFREIYGDVSGDYQVEASTNICESFDGWINFDWFSKHGRSDGFRDRTKIRIANYSFGVRFPYQFCQFTAYIGIGPTFARVWLKNYSPFCDESLSKFAAGGVLKTGIYYFFNNCFFVDVFMDYLYQPVHFKRGREIDVGGVKLGGGLGIKF